MDSKAAIYGKYGKQWSPRTPTTTRMAGSELPWQHLNASPHSSWASVHTPALVCLTRVRRTTLRWLRGQNRACAMERIPTPPLPHPADPAGSFEDRGVSGGSLGLVNSEASRTVSKVL